MTYSNADFTPGMKGYSDIKPFRFWCQKVLPLVYDDSLSYYELLCKVTDYINNIITDLATTEENVGSLLDAYNQLQDYVNNYFTNLDVQEEINNKLDDLVEDGTLTELIGNYIQPRIDAIQEELDDYEAEMSANFNGLQSATESNLQQQNDKIFVLEGRMDTFTNLPTGSTSGDAELQDIRVAYDGNTYPTAGDAVRDQASNLATGLSSVTDQDTLVNNLVNYDYDFSVVRNLAPGTNPDLATYIGVIKCGTIFRLSLTESVTFAIRLYLHGNTERSKTVPSSWLGIALTEGKKYRVTSKKISGVVAGSGTNLPSVSVYETGSTSSIGSVITNTEEEFTREFVASDKNIRLVMYINSGVTLNDLKVQVTLYEYTDPEPQIFPVNTRLRIMQYNAGMFSMGNHLSMTSDNYEEKIDNYKIMLCKYEPDVIGIQEWVENVSVNGLDDPINMNELVFNKLYPYNADYILSGSPKGRTIKSRYELTDITRGVISGSQFGYTSNCLYSLAKFTLDNKTIAILTTAFTPSSQGQQNVEIRSRLLPVLLNLIANDNYAFLITDLNNGGYGDDTFTGRDEARAQCQLAQQYGFSGIIGDYYPFVYTYKSYNQPYVYGSIDNIFYKNDGKTKFIGFRSLMDEEYDNLMSDHAPVIGDFILID